MVMIGAASRFILLVSTPGTGVQQFNHSMAGNLSSKASSESYFDENLVLLKLLYAFLPGINTAQGPNIVSLFGSIYWAHLANKSGNVRQIIMVTISIAFLLEMIWSFTRMFVSIGDGFLVKSIVQTVASDIIALFRSAAIVLIESYALQTVEDEGLGFSGYLNNRFFSCVWYLFIAAFGYVSMAGEVARSLMGLVTSLTAYCAILCLVLVFFPDRMAFKNSKVASPIGASFSAKGVFPLLLGSSLPTILNFSIPPSATHLTGIQGHLSRFARPIMAPLGFGLLHLVPVAHLTHASAAVQVLTVAAANVIRFPLLGLPFRPLISNFVLCLLMTILQASTVYLADVFSSSASRAITQGLVFAFSNCLGNIILFALKFNTMGAYGSYILFGSVSAVVLGSVIALEISRRGAQ